MGWLTYLTLCILIASSISAYIMKGRSSLVNECKGSVLGPNIRGRGTALSHYQISFPNLAADSDRQLTGGVHWQSANGL